MQEVAPGLWRLPLQRLDSINVYLLGDVLVDSGMRWAAGRLLRALEGRTIVAHAVTHAHFDHQGATHAVCERLAVPLYCGAGDRAALETGDLTRVLPRSRPLLALLSRRLGGPAHLVDRTLRDGDEVGGFTVIETPGHTPGHLAFWRESDGALVLGDVLFHRNPLTMRRALQEPFRMATLDPSRNRESARRLAELGPSVVCFGHGPPLRDGERFAEFVSSLPRD
ncbi:MAG: MBL fold metallo-hydrolase [Gemmatimonadota bacterium]|nr:MAG: MBL fold metallo-hydrolase [Gemmatimonadota bacterium]